MNVAVLGAGGFVGARLVEMAVLHATARVVPVVRSSKSLARLSRLGIAHRLADASRLDALQEAIDGCDVVVNLTTGHPAEILRTTQTIHAACRAKHVRLLVHLSSAVVYGRAERPDIQDDAPPDLRHWMLYARQKGRAEHFLRSRLSAGRPDIVVLRPGLVWGPRSPWVWQPASELVRGTGALVEDGHGICNLIYVDNLVRSIFAVIAKARPAPGFYHVADDTVVTWRQYYTALARGLDIDPASLPCVEGDRFRPTLRDRVETVTEWSSYRWLKNRIPKDTRMRLKSWLVEHLGDDRETPSPTVSRPVVTREMWDLQKTKHRLSTAKFLNTFGHQNVDSFEAGMTRTIEWLRFAGFHRDPGRASEGPPAPLRAAASARAAY